MKKISTIFRLLFVALGILIMTLPASAQEWENIEVMDSLPVDAPWRSREGILDWSSIVPDPYLEGNNLLKINYLSSGRSRGSFRYDWRLNEEAGTPEPDRNAHKGITMVFRAKPSSEAIEYMEMYPDSSLTWWYVSIRASGSLYYMTELRAYKDTLKLSGCQGDIPLVNGENIYYKIDTNWHTYRVSVKLNDVKIYLDENPTPIIDAEVTCVDEGGNQMRMGKQDRNTGIGSLFDYFLILEGDVYAPGEGPAIPNGLLVGPGGWPVGTGELRTGVQLALYPNPASDNITLRFNQERNGLTEVDVYTVTGQKVMSPFRGKLNAGQQELQINTSDLPSGVYLVSVNGDYSRFIKK